MAKKAKKRATPATNVLSAQEILKKLYALGYFGTKAWSAVQGLTGAPLVKAIKAFQTFHGLEPTGVVGPATASNINKRRCGLPDFNITAANSAPCKWPMAAITYHHKLDLPGLTTGQVTEAYDIAFSQWARVCAIEPAHVDNPSRANIYAQSGLGRANGLDDRGGTLAWSELPCGVAENIQLDQMFDEAEDWSFNMAVAVICHELGHALGLPHLSNGNLMAPYYDPNVTAPQKGDVAEIVKLYGERAQPYAITQDASLQIGGTIIINDRPYVLVPKT